MCGIAGVVHLSGPEPVPPKVIRGMADALFHRGPDEDGYLERPGLALASRRLSIVGLFDGRQPLFNEDRSVAVVYNGELFDYPEVRRELSERGHRLVTHCDTELLPHLWEDHGEEMFVRLRGQFAIALWDQRRRRLVLARDRFGICPLYWTRQQTAQGEWLLFASEIKALLASGMVEARADPRGINHAFTFFALPGPVTCFAGVNCLLPGHALAIQLGAHGETAQVGERTYWEIDFPDRGQEEPVRDRRKLVDEFEATMLHAVERRLRADVPVVSYLSGGVDSSLVVAMATKLREGNAAGAVPTYTIRVMKPGLDEASEAALVARHVGAKTVVVNFGDDEVRGTYPQLIRAAEGPVIDTACAALLLLARRVHADGYKVALTGEGSDEWMAGYPWYRAHKLLGFLDAIPGLPFSQLVRRLFLRLSDTPQFPLERIRRTEQAVAGPNAWLDVYGLYSTAKLRFFSRAMQEALADHVPYEDLRLNLEKARRWHPLNRALYVGARVMLPGLLLASKGDRVAMNSSVETRYPFLDEDVFALLAKLPPRWKLRGFREKYVLRLLSERWLPKSIAWRRKAMFRAPLDSFHPDGGGGAAGSPYVDQLFSPESLRKSGYFDPAAVTYWRKHFRSLPRWSSKRITLEMGLVAVFATQLWHHTYIDGSLADLPAFSHSLYRGPQTGIPAA
jgi:asparagine synthase (glutamine-hydrolysing)